MKKYKKAKNIMENAAHGGSGYLKKTGIVSSGNPSSAEKSALEKAAVAYGETGYPSSVVSTSKGAKVKVRKAKTTGSSREDW